MYKFIPSKTQQIILTSLANSLFGAGKEICCPNEDLKNVFAESHFQTVSLLVFSEIVIGSDIGADAAALKNILACTLSANVTVDACHASLHSVLKKAGIPYTIIKGCASARYYPDPLMRSMGDVDFLIRPDDFEKADAALKAEGYIPNEKPHAFHAGYVKNNCRFEMHTEPAGVPYAAAGEKVREYLNSVFDDAREASSQFGTIALPSDFHHGLILLLHTSHHLTGEGVGLRHLCDWAVFVNSMSEEKFLDLFEEKLRAIGLWKFAQTLTRLAITYLGCPEKKWAQADSETVDGLMADTFSGGNFGQKNPDRSHESLIISSRGKDGIGKTSMIKQFFISVNDVLYTKNKIYRKFKILLPFGWIFFCSRYVVRSLFKKRPKIRLKAVAAEASQRKKLYSKLHLFEKG